MHPGEVTQYVNGEERKLYFQLFPSLHKTKAHIILKFPGGTASSTHNLLQKVCLLRLLFLSPTKNVLKSFPSPSCCYFNKMRLIF